MSIPKICLSLFVAFPIFAASPANLETRLSAVDRIFAEEFAKQKVAGATVGVVLDGKLAWTKSYGFSDIDTKQVAKNDTVYRIGSISKQFAGYALLQLADKGKLRLSDPVEKYFPEISRVSGRPPGSSPITLLQLATHTSGLSREPQPAETYTNGPESKWEQTVIEALPTLKYQFEPGTRYSYSNIGYAILGVALSRAAGQPYTTYVEENIIKPLGLTSTAFTATSEIRSRLSTGYVARDGAPDSAVPTRELNDGRGYKVPNGALFTTIEDLGKFVSFELGYGPETVLSHKTLLDNFSRVSTATGDLRSGYGVGFQTVRRSDLVVYGHGGSVAGYTAGAYFEPTKKIGVIFLRNTGGRGFGSEAVLKAVEELTK